MKTKFSNRAALQAEKKRLADKEAEIISAASNRWQSLKQGWMGMLLQRLMRIWFGNGGKAAPEGHRGLLQSLLQFFHGHKK